MKYEVRYTVVEIFDNRKIAEACCVKVAEQQRARMELQGKSVSGPLRPHGGPAQRGYGVWPIERSEDDKRRWPQILVFEDD